MNFSLASHTPDINEPYLILSESAGFPLLATLLRVEDNLARFVIDGDMHVNDSVIACPREEDSRNIVLSIDAIREHPNRLTGKIIRANQGRTYTVRISVHHEEKKNYARSDFSSIQVDDEKPFCVLISQSGSPDLRKLIRFHDTIQEQSLQRIDLVIDVSEVDHYPPTATAIFSDLLNSLSRRKRRVSLVNDGVLSEAVRKEYANDPQIHFFTQRDEALQYVQSNPLTVLIVEDDPTTLELIRSVIHKQKWLPIPLSSGEEALQLMESNPPDLILMDVNLPGISGLETIRQIREFESSKNVPIILLTSESGRNTVKAGLELHVCGYVLKPFKSATLIQKIFTTLSH